MIAGRSEYFGGTVEHPVNVLGDRVARPSTAMPLQTTTPYISRYLASSIRNRVDVYRPRSPRNYPQSGSGLRAWLIQWHSTLWPHEVRWSKQPSLPTGSVIWCWTLAGRRICSLAKKCSGHCVALTRSNPAFADPIAVAARDRSAIRMSPLDSVPYTRITPSSPM